MARPEIWWVSLHHLHKPSRIVGVFSKQASRSSQLTLWWLHDFRKFRRMTSFSQENFRRKIHLDAPSPGLISLTWRSVVIPVIPYIESDLLGELQLWVRILRTKRITTVEAKTPPPPPPPTNKHNKNTQKNKKNQRCCCKNRLNLLFQREVAKICAPSYHDTSAW